MLGAESEIGKDLGIEGFGGPVGQGSTGLGDLNQGGASVAGMRKATDETGSLEPIHGICHGGLVHLQARSDDAHRQGSTTAEGKQHEDLVPGETDVEWLEDRLDSGEHDLMRPHDGRNGDHAVSCIIPSMTLPVPVSFSDRIPWQAPVVWHGIMVAQRSAAPSRGSSAAWCTGIGGSVTQDSTEGCGMDAMGREGSPIRVAVIGCGRIGQLHAGLLAREIPGMELAYVADAVPEAAELAAAKAGCEVLGIEQILSAPQVDAVAICSSTDTHVDLIEKAAAAGKAIFCEKPVSLDLAQVRRAREAVIQSGVPFMVGFNRRFDPGHASVRDAVSRGEVGQVQLVRITSRDPMPPPLEYLAVSGGLFMDMAIHDFDMARFVTGSEVVEVFARGAVRVDPRIRDVGDVDTAVTVLMHSDDTLTTIDNSREAVYGYDQRLEAFGSLGMAISDNHRIHQGWTMTRERSTTQPLPWFFLERYRDAYRREWEAFGEYLKGGGPSPAGVDDALAATAIALAAGRSLKAGHPVSVQEVVG